MEDPRALANLFARIDSPDVEMFPIVDERDVPVGRLSRRLVHQLGLRHRAVHLLVENSQGMIFLQKRSAWKDVAPGTWDSSASGHLLPDEGYGKAVRREAIEELGWEMPSAPAPVLRFTAMIETGWEFGWLYRVVGEGPFTLNREEIETGDWFAPLTIDAWMEREPAAFAPSFLFLWRRWRSEPTPPTPGSDRANATVI